MSFNTISELTYLDPEMSTRLQNLIHKNLNELQSDELAFLIREYIAVPICIPTAVKLLEKQEIKLALMFKDDNSQKQRELVRELILLSTGYWDTNLNYFYRFSELINQQISYLNLPQILKDNFLKYQPRKLVWNKESINEYNSYLNDSYLGVRCGYGKIVSLKRAVLNGNSIEYILNNILTIHNIDDFNKHLLNSIRCNDELIDLLNKEKAIIEG